ncbi:MAG: Ig-like domain repeat protein [Candidatus Sulfotelmatobacter sp.]
MFKATTAIASLLFVACVCAFFHLASAPLATTGVVSALLLTLVVTISGRGWRRDAQQKRLFLRSGMVKYVGFRGSFQLFQVLCLLLLWPAQSWAAFTILFNGVVSIVDTGSIVLSNPADVVVDTAGNVYLSDTSNSRIVKLAPDGTASVLAITGLAPALSSPAGLAVDVSGNLYIADAGNARVVKVDSLGNGTPVSTPSITLSSPQGVAVDASSNIFVSDTGNNRIVEVTAGGTASVLSITGLGTAFNTPLGLALDPAGDLFIADSVNSRIVEVAAGGTVGSVLNVSGVSLTTPAGVAADTLGNLYVADTTSTQIIIVNIAYGSASLINTGAVTLNQPQGVAVSASGLLYVADTADNRAISVATSSVAYGHSQLGTSTGKVLTLPFTVGIIATVGNVKVFTDGVENLDFTLQGTNTCTAGTTGDVPCSVDVQFLPTAPGLRRGAIVIYDNSNPEVPLITVPLYGSGDAPLAALSPGTAGVVSTGATALSAPFQVAFDGAGNMYVANYGSAAGNVVKVPAGGGTATVVSTPGFTLAGAIGVALDGAGNLYISDHYNSRILEVTAGGVVSALNIYGVSPALGITGAIAIDEAGNLYISDYGVGRIVKVTPSGAGSVLGTGSFTFPSDEVLGVAVDAAGTVYIPDPAGNGVVKVTAAGAASLVVAPGITPPLSSPQGVAVDAFGNLYIADAGNERIVEITTAGVASVVQMPGQSLVTDYGVTVDASGNVFIPDFGANHIVEVSVAGASLSFPNTNVGSTSPALTATVTNIGDLPLLFSTAPTYTANFSEDTGDGNLCAISTSLDPGLACDAAVEFTPQSGGNLSAGIVVTNNNLNVAGATETVAVSGTGIVVADTTAVAVSTSPTSANLGQPITITALVTDTATGHTATIPTGGVTFMDTVGSTSISLNGGAAVTLNGAGAAILTGVTLSGVGTHTITASYAGVTGTFAPSSNTTSIVISALASAVTLNVAPGSSVVAGTAATLTATVTANGAPVTTGTVLFCNATAAQCVGEAVYGSAQLTLAGTAAIKLTLGAGVYSITAAFQATSSTLAGVSAPQPLTVTGAASYLSSTTIAETGVAGNYTLTGTVTAFGAVVPTGTVSFLDTTAGNGVVGTAALNPASLGFTFLPAAGSPVGAGQAPQDTVLGDFNHDGKLDLVVLNNGDQTISVLLGNGDGTFQPQVTYAVGHQSQGIAMGDFNGDGNLDLVVSNYIDDTVSVLLGNGNGTFAPQVTYATAHRPQGIAVADFNGDGHLDLAVVATFGADVSILLGQGDGTFVADSPATFAVGGDPVAIATADFNGDGNADLVVTNSGDGSVSVLLGHGDGTFQSQIVLTIPDEPDLTPIAVGDFNGDGIPDFAVGDAEYDDIYVFLGINGLTFQPPVAYTVGVAPFGIVAADFQGTGHLDLAVTNLGDSTVSLLLNQGDGSGTFQTQVTFPAGSTPLGIAAGDLNGDGLPDLAVANNTYSAPFTASILLAAQTETAVATGQAVYGTGTHNVLASYPGDADRAPSQSTTVPLAAIPQTTTATTFTAAPNPAFAGQPVTLTATVAPAPTGTPLGTVSFYNGSALLGTATVNSSGVATFVGSLPVGVLSVTAVYSGNAGFAGSTSTAQTVTVNLNPTATALAAAPNPASVGQSVTLTATVNPPPLFDLGRRGHAVPGPISLGTVSFYYGPTLLGSGDVNSSGVATSSTTTLPVGADGLTAVYSGDSNFAGSTSIAYTETITGAATSTTTVLTALPNPAIAGQSVTLAATVAPAPTGTPTGTVSFYDGTTLLGTMAVNSSGIADFIDTSLPVGALSITAVYSGNAGFSGSTSTVVTETVSPATTATATTTTLTASPNPLFDGQTVTFTATVTPAPTGTSAGIVSFYSGTTLLGTGTLNAAGVATLTLSSLAVGVDSITAVYPGNAGFAPSTSSTLSQTVNTAYTVSGPTTPVPVAPGGSVNINLTVPPLGGAFNSVVTLSASGLPPGATATFNPPTVTPGTAGAPTVMTIQLAAVTASIPAGDIPANPRGVPVTLFSMAFLLFGGVLGRKRMRRGLVLVLALASLGVGTSLLTGCGGGFANTPSTQARTYTVTVTGTSGSFQASTTVTLVVE